ncbi:hypothetical protein [Bauldia litoralis]|uniref:hypothetical protein n=1 Tax=Bauldia litoralis TaxID=665467 RepID=UPI003265B1D2
MTPTGHHLAFGTTLVAAILFFAAFVALFRRDLGDPYIAASVFAGVGLAIGIVGQFSARAADRHARRRAPGADLSCRTGA